jgi:hypothetical protein
MSEHCTICSKTFKSSSTLSHHLRYVHCDDEYKKCPSCARQFSSKISLQRHQPKCKEASRSLWVPASLINKNKSEDRHEHQRSKISDKTEKHLQSFTEWLESGGYSRKLLAYKRKLTGNSIKTYSYHLRSYFSYLEMTDQKIDICVGVSVSAIKGFLEYLQACEYQVKTIINRLFSIERWLGFLDDRIPHLNLSLQRSVNTDKKIDEALAFIRAETKVLSPVATRDTQVRNCRQSLEKDGKWIEIRVVLDKLKEKERELQLLFSSLSNLDNSGPRPVMKDVMKCQDYVLMNLIIGRPTLRSQNFVLEILDKIQSPKRADKNGICLTNNSSILQYCKYKTNE